MEFGPRALGARSIVGDARSPAMQSVMNLKIKFRESFGIRSCRFFESTLRRISRSSGYFESLNVAGCPGNLQELRAPPETTPAIGLAKVTKSAPRFQPSRMSITRHAYKLLIARAILNFYGLLQAFYELTGCPVLINTSFNVRGEPLVAHWRMPIDVSCHRH